MVVRRALLWAWMESSAAEISRLARLPLSELRAAWQAEFRKPPPKGLWRDLLLRTLAWRIQEKAFGGLDKATLKLLEGYGQKRAGDQRCQRLKSGTVLVREFGGTHHTVTIVPEGFLWQEKTYFSLSAIAKIITGTNIAPPTPCSMRHPTITWMSVERPHSNEPRVKIPMAKANIRRVPKRSAIRGPQSFFVGDLSKLFKVGNSHLPSFKCNYPVFPQAV